MIRRLIARIAARRRRRQSAAQTIAITGGTVALGDGSDPIPNGTVVIRNGRIAAAGVERRRSRRARR